MVAYLLVGQDEMGGQVNIAFRFPDGEIICQNRWTNPTPMWFRDARMYCMDREYINQYLSKLIESESNRRSVVAPEGYGLVVFDYKSNNILSMQDYTDYRHIHLSAFIHTSRNESVKRLMLEKRLYLVNWSQNINLKEPRLFGDEELIVETDFDKFVERIKGLERTAFSEENAVLYSVRIDTRPMEYIDFDESIDGAVAFRAKLIELGFDFNKETEEAWDEWFKDQLDEMMGED